MTGAAEDKRQVQPDPENPQVINGDFELPLNENGFLQGWYYQRLLTLESDPRAPQGRQYITMRNRDAGRMAHVMQGFPIDGRKIQRLDFREYNNAAECVIFGMTLSYDGTAYGGWQMQVNSHTEVQAEVERALQIVTGQPVRRDGLWRAVASGRTDAGVHAAGARSSALRVTRICRTTCSSGP
jgi:hypothetical protein